MMKIFLCSTSFDLADLRALTVDRFGRKYGFIHFEDAAFPSRRGLHSHDQCIEAVKQADVVLAIVDRRYGGKYAGSQAAEFPEQTIEIKGKNITIPTSELSISWCELITAFKEGKHVITFARRRTMDEKATRRKNQDVEKFKPAHVEDSLIFDLLDWITKRPRDNWIVPFDTAVDYLSKLEKWLDVADGGLVPPVAPVVPIASRRKPITIVVEGQMDAEVVKAVASKLLLSRPLDVVVAGGKGQLLGNLKRYATAFQDSAGIVVLVDSDTVDPGELEIQKAQIRQIVAESARPDIRTVFAVPVIESWFGASLDIKRERRRMMARLPDFLRDLQSNLESLAVSTQSLADFIEAVRSVDRSE